MFSRRLLLALAFGVLIAPSAWADCDMDPLLVDVSEGVAIDSDTGHYVLKADESVTLSVALEACDWADAIAVDLPDSLVVEQATSDCAREPDGVLVCDDPPGESGEDGVITQAVSYTIAAADHVDVSADPITLNWPVEARFGGISTLGDDDGTVIEQGIVIQGDVDFAATGPVFMPNPVAAGEPLEIQHGGFVEANGELHDFALVVDDRDAFSLTEVQRDSSDDISCTSGIALNGGILIECSVDGGNTYTSAWALHGFLAPQEPGQYTVTASASGVTGSGTGWSDSSTQELTVEDTSCELSASKTHQSDFENDTVYVQQPFDWVINVSAPSGNGADAEDIQVTDQIPSDMSYNGYSGTNWSCSHSGESTGGTVTCNYSGVLAAGDSAPTLLIHTIAGDEGDRTNGMNATSTTCDNDDDIHTVTVLGPGEDFADVSLTKSGPTSVAFGAQFDWTIDIENTGPEDAEGFELTDTLPAGTSFVSVTSSGALSCSGGSTVTCTAAILPEGSHSVTITVEGTEAGSWTNTCTGSADAGGVDDTACEDTVTVEDPEAQLSVSKSGPSSVSAGETFTWRIDTANLGPDTIQSGDLTVTDSLPGSVTFDSMSAFNWSCSGTSTITCTYNNSLGANEQASAIFINVTAPDEGTTVSNCATANSSISDPVQDCDSVTVVPEADLTLSKSAPTSVDATDDFNFTLNVSNQGPSTAENVEITDDLPGGVSFNSVSSGDFSCSESNGTVTCTRGSWASGASDTITINVTAPSEEDTLNNCASIDSDTNDPDTGNNNDCASTDVVPKADLALTKTGPASVDAAQSFSYELDVSNLGPSSADSVTVTDNLPAGVSFDSASSSDFSCNENAGTVTCTRGSWASGASDTITLNVTAPDEGGDITNCAEIDSATDDPDMSNNSDCASTTVNAQADLALTKSAPSSVTAAESFSFTLSISNFGPSTSESVEVTDDLPDEVTFESVSGSGWNCSESGGVVTCTRASLSSGASSTITIDVTAPDQETSFTNCGEVSAATSDPDLSNNEDCATTTVVPEADLELTKSGPSQVDATDEFSYNIQVTNHGPSDAEGAEITDDIPSGMTFISGGGDGWSCSESGGTVTCDRTSDIPVGASRTATINVEAPAEGGDLTNCAEVSSFTSDPDLSNNDDCHTTTVNPLADLSLSKTGPGTVLAGSSFDFTLSVANSGPSSATDVVVTDALPGSVEFNSASGSGWSCSESGGTVTCERGSWSAGANSQITINVTAPDDAGTVTNCGEIDSATDDPDTTNNSDCHTTTVEPSADLAIAKTGPGSVNASDSFSFDIDVSNQGPSDAADVVVTDTVPADLVVDSVSSSFFACTANGQDITCNAASMAAGASGAITIDVTAPDEGGNFTNCANVDSAVQDPDLSNNDDCHTVSVIAQADLTASKSGPGSVEAAEVFSYQLSFENLGPSTAENVEIFDAVPAGSSIVGYSSADIGCTISNDELTCTTASMASGETILVDLEVQAPDEGGDITNCTSINSTTNDPDLSNNDDCHDTTVLARAEVSVEKTSVEDPVAAAHDIEWIVTVTNDGPSTATDVEVVDTLPDEVTFISVDDSGVPFTCAENAGEITCNAGSLSVGSYDIFITVQAPDEPQDVTNVCVLDTSTPPPSGTDPSQECDDTVTVERAVDISLDKTSTPDVVVAATEYEYVISAGNGGPSDAIDIEITDSFPADVSFVSLDSAHNCTYDSVDHTLTCLIDELAAGGSTDIVMTVQAPDEGGDITNICVADYPGIEMDPSTLNCEADTEITPESDLSVSKVPSSSVVEAAEAFEYQIQLSNAGPSTAENVSVEDDLPADLIFDGVTADSPLVCSETGGVVSCSASELPVGDYTITIDVIAPDEGGQVNNVCVVDSDTDDPDPIAPEDCDDGGVTIEARAELSASKSAAENSVLAGDPIHWTVDFANEGPSTGEDILLVDTLPDAVELVSFDGPAEMSCSESGGVITCSADTLAVGSYSLEIEATAPDEPQDVTNVCTLDGSLPAPDGAEQPPVECEHTVTVERAVDLSLDKTSPTTAVAGSEYNYTVSASNAGPSTAVDVQITDLLPAEVTFVSAGPHPCVYDEPSHEVVCDVAQIGPGDSTDVVITVQAPDEGMDLVNTCIADYPGTELDESTLDCETDTEITPSSDLSVSKTPSSDVVAVDEPFHYEILLTNSGPSTATDVSITDDLPDEPDFVSVDADAPLTCSEAGGVVTCSAAELPVGDYLVTINMHSPEEEAEFDNICVVDSSTDDPDPIAPEDCDDGGVFVEPQADLQLEKRALDEAGGSEVSEVEAGDSFIWEIRIENHGPSTAENVVVEDSIPAEFTVESVGFGIGTFDITTSCNSSGQDVSCSFGDLDPNEFGLINIEVTAPADAGSYTNVCSYTSDTTDPNPSDCEDVIGVEGSADLRVSKIAFVDAEDEFGEPVQEVVTEVDAGEVFFYRVSLSNDGPSEALNAVLVDDLPEAIEIVDVSGFDDGCTLDETTVTCLADSVADGGSRQLLVEAVAPERAMTLVNLASVSSETSDPDPDNNDVEHELDVLEDPILGLAKAATMVESIGAGQWEARLMLTLRNYGNVPLDDVQVAGDYTEVFPSVVPWSVSDLSVEGDLETVNTAFDGSGDVLLLSGDETLPVDGEAVIRMRVQFEPGATHGPYWAQSFTSGFSTTDAEVLDTSHNGLDPNPDNTHPNNWTDPTPIQFDEDPGIGLAKWVETVEYEGNGLQRFDIGILVENFGNVPLLDVQASDDLAETFAELGAEDIVAVTEPVVSGALAGANPNFDGVEDTNMLTGDEMLDLDEQGFIEFSVTVNIGQADVGPYLNRAHGSGTSPGGVLAEDYSQDGMDPNPSGSGDPTDDNDPTPLIPLHADIAMSKEMISEGVAAGEPISWRLTAHNLGPDHAEELVVTDFLPDNVTFDSVAEGPFTCSVSGLVVTCELAFLDADDSASFELTAIAPDDGGTVINTCVAESGMPDPNPDSSECESDSDVGGQSELVVVKESVGDVISGQPFTYQINVSNLGPSAADDVVMMDDLPAGLTFEAVSADSPFECDHAEGVVTCLADQLPVGDYDISIDVIAPDEPGPIENVCVISTSTDMVGDEPECVDVVEPEPSANLSMSKYSDPDTVAPGQVFDWVIEIENEGPTDAEGVMIADDVPEPSTVLGVSSDAFDCTAEGNEVSCLADTLAVGVHEIRIETEAPDEPGPITNTCVIESDSHDPEPVDDCGGSVEIDDAATLMTRASASKSQVLVGEDWYYNVSLRNAGGADLTEADLVMALNGTAGEKLGLESNGVASCNSNGTDASWCIADVVTVGDAIHARIHMKGRQVGQHSIYASGDAANPLSEDSVTEDTASVSVVASGVEGEDHIPIPVMDRTGLVVFALLMLIAGWFGMGMMPGAQRSVRRE